MTIHKIKEEFILKASIGELMAAMNGIVCAGVTATKAGADTMTDPVASLGYKSALLSYDIRHDLSFARLTKEKAASKITEFLKSSFEVLGANAGTVLSLPKGATGGNLKDVLAHISDILMREEIGGERPAVKIVNGNLEDKFKAAYMPTARKEDMAEPEFDGDAAEDAAPKKSSAPRVRKKSYASAAPASALS